MDHHLLAARRLAILARFGSLPILSEQNGDVTGCTRTDLQSQTDPMVSSVYRCVKCRKYIERERERERATKLKNFFSPCHV
jgi:hypothetical protein